MANINVREIVAKYITQKGDPLEENIQAIKEIVEAIVDKCAEEATMSIEEELTYKDGKHVKPYKKITESGLKEENHYEGQDDDPVKVFIDKDSILNVKTMIDYE